MKLRPRQTQQPKVKTQLKARLVIIGSVFALATAVGIGVFISLNVGAPGKAMAAPSTLTGVINSYLRVTAISSRTFTADNLSGTASDFGVGKTIMVYQVKGANINTTNSSSYGTITALNNAGLYEFAVVSAFSGSGPYTITVSALTNNYNAAGAVQLISVPTYVDATVSGTVSATAWSATLGRGGVVAMQVSNDLTLGANISVAGQGFKGGGVTGATTAGCPDATTFRSNATNFGSKGEGISTDGFLYAIGAQANGGGGGNPHNAGGGGGGNHTSGGNGGRGYQPGGSCAVANAGGLGGKQMAYTSTTGRIFFGGGGGAGHQNDALGSGGANGGGIIVVRAKNVKSTCSGTYGFNADGNDALNSVGNDGGGGGGAGGVIVLDVQTYSLTCKIFARADGGNGGTVVYTDAHGGGSAGGIGVILEVTPSSTSNVTMVSANGVPGRDCSSCSTLTATNAGPITSSKISSGAIPGTGVIVMPVKLISFSGIASGRDVELSWVTATENNNHYFIIQRSADGVKFDSIGTVQGNGNSTSKITYGYSDVKVPGSAAYYRLKQVDYDGITAYSKIAYVILAQSAAEDATTVDEIEMYPNPADNQVIIKAAGLTSVRILNQQGDPVYSRNVAQAEHTADISNITEGIYIVEIFANGKKIIKKLVIKH